nr:hypothetical protein Q903MT_gene2834 [Picea sitchensis]
MSRKLQLAICLTHAISNNSGSLSDTRRPAHHLSKGMKLATGLNSRPTFHSCSSGGNLANSPTSLKR